MNDVIGSRGLSGRGGGASMVVQVPPEWRASTVQACGLWPFTVGSGTPMVGVPMGHNLSTGATLCCDPINWFQRAHLIGNPSAMLLANPGLGKSTILRRWAVGLDWSGVTSLFLGDVKGEHVDVVRALGGQVIPLGRGRGSINIFDPGAAGDLLPRLSGRLRDELAADIHTRRCTMTQALVSISRSGPVTDREATIIDRAIRLLADHVSGRWPLMGDLIDVIRQAPDGLRAAAQDRGDLDRYLDATDDLVSALTNLAETARFGDLFAHESSERMRLDRPVDFDISAIPETDGDVLAAALMACWSAGFANVLASQVMAEAGLGPRRVYFLVLDELWRALRAGRGMVDRVDSLTRLNRSYGVGQAMASHTMSDLLALPDEEDRMKARGFVERAGMVVCGGLPSAEMDKLNTAVTLSRREQDLLTSWQTPPSWDEELGRQTVAPGAGNFLVKVKGRPGIPFHLDLTDRELHVNDTNRLWHDEPGADDGEA